MLSWIDQLARIIGYGAIVIVLIWLLSKWLQDRGASRAAQIESMRLAKKRLEQPEAYEQEMWWRDNDQRFKAGLPTDTGYIEQMNAVVKSLREEGHL